VIESTEFSEKAACLILFVKSNRRLFLFVKADIRNPIQIPLMPH